MALREIRILGDEILRKKSKKVEKVDERLKQLLSDMAETMLEFDGVGLAGPQVGILKRVIVVLNGKKVMKLVNPYISEPEGSSTDYEGCLSVKKKSVKIERPEKITVTALDENGKEIKFIAEGFFARIICHEVDHLEGILIVDKNN